MWPNPQFSADLVTFTEEILNGKLESNKNNSNPKLKKFYKNVVAPFQESSLLLTTTFLGVPDINLTELGRMKGWANVGPTSWFPKWDLCIDSPAL